METQSLSSEISACIEEFGALLEKEPTNEILYKKIKDMYAALEKAEEKEWNIQTECYKSAKFELDNAKVAAQKAIDDLSKTAKAITQATAAIEKTLAILAYAV